MLAMPMSSDHGPNMSANIISAMMATELRHFHIFNPRTMARCDWTLLGFVSFSVDTCAFLGKT